MPLSFPKKLEGSLIAKFNEKKASYFTTMLLIDFTLDLILNMTHDVQVFFYCAGLREQMSNSPGWIRFFSLTYSCSDYMSMMKSLLQTA